MIGGRSCLWFKGSCEDVCCNNCADRQTIEQEMIYQTCPLTEQEIGTLVEEIAGIVPTSVYQTSGRTPRVEGSEWAPGPTVSNNEVVREEDRDAFMPADNVMHPAHYSRWPMEPIEFIAINDLPWWLANLIKYTMRWDAKDGIQDLYKGRSYLEMKIRQLEGHERFWVKPATEERALNELPEKAA